MPNPPSAPTSADIQWITPGGNVTDLVVTGPGVYSTLLRRVKGLPNFTIISDWVTVSSDIAGSFECQVSNIGDRNNAPSGRLLLMPTVTYNLQTDEAPYTCLIDASFNYMQLVLTVTAGAGTFYSQFAGGE